MLYSEEQIREAAEMQLMKENDVDCLLHCLKELFPMEPQQLLNKHNVSGALPLVEALDKYIELLVEELNETASMASTHGWKSSRVDVGEQMRNRIAELRR